MKPKMKPKLTLMTLQQQRELRDRRLEMLALLTRCTVHELEDIQQVAGELLQTIRRAN